MYFREYATGTVINFNLRDVICPDFDQVIDKITKCLELSGRIVFMSDSGEKRDHYAVVQVDGVMSPLIVPIDNIKSCDSLSEDSRVDAARD